MVPRHLAVGCVALSGVAVCVTLSLMNSLRAHTEAHAAVSAQESMRQPRFTYTETAACGDVYVFTANADRTEVIWVSIELKGSSAPAATVLPLPPTLSVPLKLPWVSISAVPIGVREYDVAMPKDGLRAGLDFNGPEQGFYCTDLSFGPPVTWPAVAGHVSLTIRHPDTPTVPCSMDPCLVIGYPLELTLDRMTFQSPDGRRADLPAPLTLRASGGLMAGG